MHLFCDTLMSELESQLTALDSEITEPLWYHQQAMMHSMAILERLNQRAAQYQFPDEKSEIDFYRNRKPLFIAKVIYYRTLYTLSLNQPPRGKKILDRYYKSELRRLQQHFAHHLEFYRYYRSGNPMLDALYFTKNGMDTLPGCIGNDLFFSQADHKVGTLIAHELLTVFLEGEITRLKSREQPAPTGKINPSLSWTASKVALVELVYGLHSSGVFNNGTVPLTEIAHTVEAIFNVELGQFHRTFLEIRGRKSDRTKFLNSLKENLLTRMDEADEH